MADLMTILTNPLVEAVLLGGTGYLAKTKWATIKAVAGKYIPSLNQPARVISTESYSERFLREVREGQEMRGRRASMQPVQLTQPALQPVQRPMQDAAAWLADAEPVMQSIKLSTIAAANNVLVVGPTKSGKTTILRTLLSARADTETIALDPHDSPGKWLCLSVGGGLRWDQINAAMQKMQRDMQMRFEDLATGSISEGAFPRRSYVGDEFLVIASELDGKNGNIHAGKLLISRLTQGRKVGECILIAAQNDTVEALGIQGNSDLKGCFDYIIFLGALVSTRAAKFHGCPPEIVAAAQKSERVGVVWHPERNNWYMLLLDLPLVLEGQVSIVSQVVPASSQEPVPVKTPDMAGSRHGNQFRVPAEPVPGTDGIDAEMINELHLCGWSNNRIATKMRGRREDRLARIREALGSDASDID